MRLRWVARKSNRAEPTLEAQPLVLNTRGYSACIVSIVRLFYAREASMAGTSDNPENGQQTIYDPSCKSTLPLLSTSPGPALDFVAAGMYADRFLNRGYRLAGGPFRHGGLHRYRGVLQHHVPTARREGARVVGRGARRLGEPVEWGLEQD